ncbi:MAG: glycosyltransferase family 2 protein [archaeon]
MKVGILICAYNEGKYIRKVVNKCLKYVKKVIVVDDGSKDNTLDEVRKTKAKILRHGKNKGKGEALRKGFDYGIKEGYDYLILLDGDGQHDPKEIPKFLEAIKGNPDLVVGCRMKRHSSMPYQRRVSNFATSVAISVTYGTWIKDTQSGYRAVRLKSLKKLKLKGKGYDLESEMLIKMMKKKANIWAVPIKTIYGDEKSSINPVRDSIKFVRSFFRK